MKKMEFKALSEIMLEGEQRKEGLESMAAEGKAKWGAWRYNPDNMTLEIDSKVSGYPEDNPYYVDLERCNTSAKVLDRLCQLLYKEWCPPQQVGYLLKAIDELAGGLQDVMCSCGANLHFDMTKRLRNITKRGAVGLLTVQEVADRLRVRKLTVYRMVKDGRLKAIRLPLGRRGELRISEDEVNRLLGLKGNADKK